MDDIYFIENVYKKTLHNEIAWKLESEIPSILYRSTDIFIISCYSFSNENGILYLFKYRYQAYDPEHDNFYFTEKVVLSLFEKQQITWSSQQNYPILYDLYDVVSNYYSGMSKFFS